MTVSSFLLALVAIFVSAKLLGELAERLGQPAVLGELLAGIVVGASGLRLVDSHDPTIHLLAQLGVILLLFLIGLETDLKKMLEVGSSAFAVAVVGVILPFVFGFAAGRWLGYSPTVAIFLGASLTATSVGITARVFSDLGHLHDKEARIVLGAAVVDDIIGLIILSVVSAMAAGTSPTLSGIAGVTAIAFGFVVVAIVAGSLLAPGLVTLISRLRVSKALFFASIVFAFVLAWLAEQVGSALIVGAFAAGLVLARTKKGAAIEREVHEIAQFFIPIFFVSVGAAVDLRALDPREPASLKLLLLGLLLTAVGIAGKVLAGWAVLERHVRRIVVGVGMIPRGEVGLIFATIGLTSGVISTGLYSAVALMVMLTTLVTPPMLRRLLPRRSANEPGAVSDLVSEAPFEDEPS